MKSGPKNSTDRRSAPAGAEEALVRGRDAFLGFLNRRLGNRADAENVLQEFCIRVLARKQQIRDTGRMNAWLYAILRSALNDHYRKKGRMERRSAAYARETQGEGVLPDASEAMARVCTCAYDLVPELRPSDAELIRRIDIAEEDRASVAADLGVTKGTLAVRLHRARVALRDRMLGHCGCCCEQGFEDCSCPPGGHGDPGQKPHSRSEPRVA